MVFTIEGRYIGDGAEFVEHVRNHYGKVVSITKEAQKRRTMHNIELVNEQMRKQAEELTVRENIDKQLGKVIKRKLVKHQEGFLVPTQENLSHIYVQQANLFTPERTLDVPDEVLIEKQRQQEHEKREALRDMTWDEFRFKFEDHLEGKVKNERVPRESRQDDGVSRKSRMSVSKGKKKSRKSETVEDDDEDDVESKSVISKKAD